MKNETRSSAALARLVLVFGLGCAGAWASFAADISVLHTNGTTTSYSAPLNTDASRGDTLRLAVMNGVAGDQLTLAAKVFDVGAVNTLPLNSVSPGLSIFGAGRTNTEIRTQTAFTNSNTAFISVGNSSTVSDLTINDTAGAGVFSFPVGVWHAPAASNVVLSNLTVFGKSDCVYMVTLSASSATFYNLILSANYDCYNVGSPGGSYTLYNCSSTSIASSSSGFPDHGFGATFDDGTFNVHDCTAAGSNGTVDNNGFIINGGVLNLYNGSASATGANACDLRVNAGSINVTGTTYSTGCGSPITVTPITVHTLWYVDPLAAGANNGTSWANAWTSFAAINWASVNPGDTVFLSGGTVSQAYSGLLTFGKSGTPGIPVTVRIGQDAGHNGIAILSGNYVDMSGKSYVTLDGNFGGAQHIALNNFFDTVNRTFANKVYADSSTGVVVRYCSFDNVNQCVSLVGSQGFNVNHCVATNVRGDAAVRAVNCPDNGYNSHFVEYNSFSLAFCTNCAPLVYGPDGVQGSHGLTVRYNTFTVQKVNYTTSTQHPDYTQIIGNHIIIDGNDFLNVGDSCNDIDMWANPTLHDWKIINNTYRIVADLDPGPEYIRLYSSSATMSTIADFLIANNTFIDNGYNNIRLIWRGNPLITRFVIENNIWVNSNPYEIADDTTFGTSPLIFSNNIYYPGSTAISYRCAPGGGFTACNNYTATSWSAIEPSRIVGLPAFASYSYRAAGNDLHLATGDTVARGAGLDLSAYFTTDKDGFPRSVPWADGAYQGSSTPMPGTIGLSASAYSTTEAGGTVAVVLRRSNGSSGAVSVHYATANGTAASGVNYTSASGTKTWVDGDSSDQVVNVTVLTEPFNGQKQFTFGIGSPTGSASLDTVTNAAVVITGSGVNTILAGTSWPATDGQISAPFVKSGTDYIVQASEITDPTLAGRATFTFTNVAPQVVVVLSNNAAGDANNSVFFNFDTDPTSPTMISDIPITSGFENRTLSWRGNGTFDQNQFVPKVFNLSLGLHTLIILGREANVQIAHVSVQPPSANLPPITPTNSLPAPSALNVAPLTTLIGSPYSDPGASAHTNSQFQVYLASQTSLFWDSGDAGAVESVMPPYLPVNTVFYWTLRYQNAFGLWSPWSALTQFQTRKGLVLNLNHLRANVVTTMP